MNLQHKLTKKITRSRLRPFIEKHSNNRYTLDIGCSDSKYSKYFKNRVGLDINPGEGVDVVGDAHKLPFPDSTFEQILCTEVLEHLHSPEIAVKEMYRVLKPGGKVLLTTRFIFPIHDSPNDYYRYTKYGLSHLFRNWRIEDINAEVNTMETIAVLLQRIGFQTNMRANFLAKFLVFFTAKIFMLLNFMIIREYGDINRTTKEESIMTSGYYLVAYKR